MSEDSARTNEPTGAVPTDAGSAELSETYAQNDTATKNVEQKTTTTVPPPAVRFAPGTVQSSSKKVVVRRSRRSPHDDHVPNQDPFAGFQGGRQKIGKANLKRDVPIFMGVLGFLFLLSFMMGDVGRVPTKEEIAAGLAKEPTDLKSLKKSIGMLLEHYKHEEEGRRRKTECGLFLSQSSVPNSGLSWYAGRSAAPGELVLAAGKPLQADGHEIFENYLLLKHHPFIVNVKRGENNALHAARYIQAGEELFIAFQDHPHSKLGDDHALFASVPTPKDYKLAEEIYTDEAETHLKAAKSNRKYQPGTDRKFASNRSAGGDKGLEMIILAVGKFNKRVANLLPDNLKTLKRWVANPLDYPAAILTNRTVYWLEVQAKCMDDVVERDGSVYAHRSIDIGKIITVAPLHVTQKGEECKAEPPASPPQESQTGSCVGNAKSPVLLCPISTSSSVKFARGGSINAKFQWGGWNSLNHAARRISPQAVISNHRIGLTMDIVATRKIEVGDEIIVDIGKGKFVDYGIEMNDDDFPVHWRPETVAAASG